MFRGRRDRWESAADSHAALGFNNGSRLIARVTQINYSDEARGAIADALGLCGDEADSAIADIQVLASLYELNTSIDGETTAAKEKELIARIARDTKRLVALLDLADLSYLAHADIPHTRETLNTLARVAHAAAALPAPSGRPPDHAFRWFVEQLGILYTGVTGKAATITYNPIEERYEGSFFSLVRACLTAVPSGRSDTNAALGKALQRALKPMDQTP